MKFKYVRLARNNFHIDQNSRQTDFHPKHHGKNLKFCPTDPPTREKRTLCSDSSINSVHGRQTPKEHRREGLTCFRSGPSLRLSSGAAAFPPTVNFRLCPEAKVFRAAGQFPAVIAL
jgi:hypothetical protein